MNWTRYYDEHFPGGIEVVRNAVRGSATVDDEQPASWPPIKSKAEKAASLRWRASQKLEEAESYRALAKWEVSARTKIRALQVEADVLNADADRLAEEAAHELAQECERLMLEPARRAAPEISRAAKIKERLRQARWIMELSRETNLSGEPSAYSVGQVRRLEAEIAKFWDWSE